MNDFLKQKIEKLDKALENLEEKLRKYDSVKLGCWLVGFGDGILFFSFLFLFYLFFENIWR